MWIIIKSAGDDYSFTEMYVDAPVGHKREYAQKQAEEVTAAMKAYKQGAQRTSACCHAEIVPSIRKGEPALCSVCGGTCR